MSSNEKTISLWNLPCYEELRRRSTRYPDTNSAAVEAILMLFRVSTDTRAATDSYFAQINMSAGRITVLATLNRDPREPLSPSTLAERAGVTRATMTGLLERLERDGLVARSPDAQDRRREMVLLTSRGRKLLNKVMPDFYQRVAAIMEGLTAQEQRSLIDVLYRIRQRIDAMTNPSMTAKKSDARADNPAR